MPNDTIEDLEKRISKRKTDIRKSSRRARRSDRAIEEKIAKDPEILSWEASIQQKKDVLAFKGKRKEGDNSITNYLDNINPSPNLATPNSGAMFKKRPLHLPYSPAPGHYAPPGYQDPLLHLNGLGLVGKEQFEETDLSNLEGLLGEGARQIKKEEEQRQKDAMNLMQQQLPVALVPQMQVHQQVVQQLVPAPQYVGQVWSPGAGRAFLVAAAASGPGQGVNAPWGRWNGQGLSPDMAARWENIKARRGSQGYGYSGGSFW